MSKAIFKVAIIGGGAMGRGIALLISQQGVPVVIKEVDNELAYKSLTALHKKLDSAVERGKLMLEKAEMAKGLVTATGNYDDIVDADLFIEAVFENMDVKKAVFAELDDIASSDAIFATNTSSLSITEMGSVTNRPDRIVGMHFFNPPVTMPLVELIRGTHTSDETFDSVESFAKDSLGKVTIRVKECPAFLVNRLLMPYLNIATLLLSETTLTVEQIDEAARDFGWPMGPFFLMDYLGIDVCVEVAKICYAGYGPRAKAAPLMEKLVSLGRLGNKSGAGFYSADDEKFGSLEDFIAGEFPNRNSIDVSEGYRRAMIGMVMEAFLCLEDEISSANDIETGCKYGIGFPAALEGPLHWAESEGLGVILEDVTRFGFEPPKLLKKMSEGGTSLFESW